MLDLLAARTQQVRSDVVQSLVMLDVGEAGFRLVVEVEFVAEEFVVLFDCLFELQARGDQGLVGLLAVTVQGNDESVCVLDLVVDVALDELPR